MTITSALCAFLDGTLEDVEAGLELVVRHDERCEEADDIAVDAGAFDEQAVLRALVDDGARQSLCRLLRCLVLDKLEPTTSYLSFHSL